MRRVGFSLVLLLLSTAALAGTPEKSGAEQPSAGNPVNREVRGVRRLLVYARSERAREHGAVPSRSRVRADHSARLHAIGRRQIGAASWYALPGKLTASGERMNDSRFTAAHRWLPLLSYARVTNLENGRSVVVLINDRGPLRHRFIIDLSPRAAAAIGMLHRGVAEVAVQPVARHPLRAVQRIAAAE
jgi:rare lipoprotein A (peptidoglycan hydrolase)